MPRVPDMSGSSGRIGESVFSPVAARAAALRAQGLELFPLHVGDTWLEPPEGCRMEDLACADHPGLHRYPADTRGLPALLDALVERARCVHALPCERESVLVTAGATLGLGNALAALIDPGDEVLLLAPYWPLIRGVVHAHRGQPREVPFFDRVDSAEAAVATVRERITPRTSVLYVSTPSNPTGRVLPESWLAALAELARAEGLWILADEVYDQLVYTGRHVSIGRFAPERTVTCFSFSKTYALSGCRIGYLVGPKAVVGVVHRVAVHTGYNASVPAQWAALRALERGGAWLARARDGYARAGREAAARLGLPAPEGATFLFVPVPEAVWPDDVEATQASATQDVRSTSVTPLEPRFSSFLHACLDDGVQVAPGHACGHGYARFVRICYTAMPPERLAEGVARLARRLGLRPVRSTGTPAAPGTSDGGGRLTPR
jgi:N-succinyldiaminopimelate aminotransferase